MDACACIPAGTRRNLDALACNFRRLSNACDVLTALALLVTLPVVACTCWRPSSAISFTVTLIGGLLSMGFSVCWQRTYGTWSDIMRALGMGQPPEDNILPGLFGRERAQLGAQVRRDAATM